MSIVRLKREAPGDTPPAGYCKVGVDLTGAYIQFDDGSIQYMNGTGQGAGIYGSNFHLFQSKTLQTISTTTKTSKIDQNTLELPVGTYEISVSYSWNYDSTGSDFLSYLEFDGNPVSSTGDTLIHQQEPQDSGGTWGATGTDQRFSFTKKYYVDVSTAGIKNIKLDFASGQNGTEASMWDASIKIIRVS